MLSLAPEEFFRALEELEGTPTETNHGLFYHKGNGEKVPVGDGEVLLTLAINGDKFRIRNYSDGKVNESYHPQSKDQAIVYMTSLICGYQPPRNLLRRDIPIPQTQSEGV